MVGVDKHFEGGQKDPFKPSNQAFSLPGQVLFTRDSIMSGFFWCTMVGAPGRHGGSQIGSSGLLQTGRYPLVGVGRVSSLRLGLKGRSQVSPPSDLQLLKVPGSVPPHPTPCQQSLHP